MLTTLETLPAHEIAPGYVARMVHSERMTLVYWDIEAGAPLPEHSHPHEQVCNVLKGEFELVVSGIKHPLRVGDVFVIPPNATHSGVALTSCRLLDVFCPAREDYRL